MRMRLATTLFWIAALAPAARTDEPPGAIRGKAFIAGSDRPAARVTLRFFDRDAPRLTVDTDAGGRFRCAVPTGIVLPAIREGQPGPACWMEPQESGRWTWEPIHLWPLQRAEDVRRSVSDAILKPARTTWRERGGLANLEVECPPTGDVEVLVRGPGGAPMVDRPVRIIPAQGTMGMYMPVAVRFDGRTDSSGRFRIRWFEGTNWLKVVVPGEGFGSTGLFEVQSGRVARQETPPLARTGSIEGRLDPKLAGPSTAVVLEDLGRYLAEATCDPQGRFALRDVRPGTYQLRVWRDRRPAGSAVAMRVAPGQRVVGVVIGPEPPAPPRAAQGRIARGPRSQPGGAAEEGAVVEGTVRDEQGRGVAGAGVYARLSLDGGMRMYEMIQAATTGEGGRFRISGPRRGMLGPATIIVRAEGRPPALAFAPAPGGEGRPAALDLTLPDAGRGGSVRVTVLRDGEPLAGASVGLSLDLPDLLSFGGYRGAARGPARDAYEALIHPTAVTGPDGVARLDGLLPGRYKLAATERGPVRFDPWARDRGSAFAIAEGLSVAEGRETAFAMVIHPQPCTARLQVLRPDGSPVASQSVSLSIGLGATTAGASVALDAQGRGSHDFESPGLWTIDVRFRDTAPTSSPISTEPFYQAGALLPVSPASASEEPIRLVGVRREPGSLRVRLLGVDGLPACGTVQTIEPFNQPEHAASTDDRGVVVFRDMPSGTYRLRGFVDGAMASVPDPSRPPREDSGLRGQVMVPIATAVVESGRESTIELRARPVGYVRGTIRPPAGHKASEYTIVPGLDLRAVETQWRLDPESGRFFCGPLLPGKIEHRFSHQAGDGTWQSAGAQTVEVPAGDVVHVEFRPEESEPRSSIFGPGQPAMSGLSGVRVLERDPGAVVGPVVLVDGKTPAFAAEAMLYVPEHSQPVASGLSDAGGRLTWRGRAIIARRADGEGTGRVDRPTVVVRIPGRTGATVLPVEPGRPVRVTLPAPRSAEGRVTLGGRPVGGRNARVRVVARYKGRGALDEALSVETTAQADGRFELRGLTPGRYAVQAARDGIWLSPSIELTVADDRDPPPLAMDVPEPGRAVELHVVDRAGRPAAGRPIGLVRPEGPLASLWPATLHTDPDGMLTLRGLEAGRHALLIGEDRERREIVVPAADGVATRPVVERMFVP